MTGSSPSWSTCPPSAATRSPSASRRPAKKGDLKENGGYHAAKDEQGKQEARIRTLEALLKTAKVGELRPAAESSSPAPWSPPSSPEAKVFLLGSREIAAGSDLDVYSEASPLGQAILGLKVGEKSSYEAPNGREISVEIVNVETYTG